MAGGTNGVPLKRMRSGTFLPSAMTARHSVKRSFSFPGGGRIHGVSGKRRGVSGISMKECFNDWGGRGYDDSVPGDGTKTTPSGDRTT